MSPKDTPEEAKPASPTFDQSLGRLEEIVVELEGGGLGLESSLDRYKEGVGLLKGCRERLSAFRAQVEELKPDGTVVPAGGPGGAPGGAARSASAGPRGSGAGGGTGRGAAGGAPVEPELDTPF